MPHQLFRPILRQYLDEGDDAGMREFCESLHPATIAETLEGDFTTEEGWRLLRHAPVEEQAAVFEYLSRDAQVAMAEVGDRAQLARIIERMSHDDRVDLIGRLPTEVSEEILKLVNEGDRRDIAALRVYPEQSVGSLMTTDFAWIPVTMTAEEAINRLRQQAAERETIYYFYVLDEQTRQLRGVVSLRNLILAPPTARVSDLMDENVIALKATDDQEEAARQLARYDFLALPVTDDNGRLVGIVTHDDALDVVQQEATEDMQRQGAIGPMTEHYLEANFFTIWRKRAFWLACLFGAELFTFTALASFEEEIARLVVLSLFIPLCISTGGNSGSQAATLVTRALALGHVGVRDWLRVFRHELLMGIVLGLTLGVIGFFRGAVTSESKRSATQEREHAFLVRVPTGTELQRRPNGQIILPSGTVQLMETTADVPTYVALPAETSITPMPSDDPSVDVYRFPPHTLVSTPPIDRWKLALVIAQSVAAICLWGTLVGSMLPLLFKRIGADPGMASSPFVATFVDVTGIIIYFSIAKYNLF